MPDIRSFERFTASASEFLLLAEETALTRGHAEVGPAHLVIALTQREALTEAVGDLGLRRDDLLAQLPAAGESEAVDAPLPLDADLKRCVEGAIRAALVRGDNWIGADHIATGLARHVQTTPEGLAARMLATAGVAPEELTDTVRAAELAALPPAPAWLTDMMARPQREPAAGFWQTLRSLQTRVRGSDQEAGLSSGDSGPQAPRHSGTGPQPPRPGGSGGGGALAC